MSEEEIIETLKEFEKNRAEKLKEPSRNLFYAIMKIADERDKYKEILDKIKEELKNPDRDGFDEDGYDDSYYDMIYTQRIYDLLEEIE